MIECSAEPLARVGVDGDTRYVVGTNLVGAYNCLELRRDNAQFVFLSTSRVYPYATLDRAGYEEAPTRFELAPDQELPGLSAERVSESFPLDGRARCTEQRSSPPTCL